MSEVEAVLKNLDWSPLIISLKTGVVATAIAFFLGILIAEKLMYSGRTARSVLDGILTLPLVLPPTVVGFFLLLLFSKRRPFGSFLYEQFGIRVVQSWLGCIIAAVVISFPLMYRNARSAFEQVDVNLIYAARTLGMSEISIFFRVIVPCAKPGILSGTILTFARAMGEYGATSMLAGNIPGRTATISQKVAMVMQDQDYLTAGIWVAVIVIISFGIIFLLNYVTMRKEHQIRKW
ncbi:MAG: molybdate ABC transporter permease subunit [Lachnospiraceae bacterium]|jgi:molybdate transport system permease protein|nr:molybdate ABC transporter permease subunit [Lachnospiraceae bacterium]MCI1327807.1 molybdate ABC transporter permease subunit [Lachnospiraceae bacterium]